MNEKRVRPRMSTRLLVMVALLTAMQVVLSRFLSFAVWNMKIGFAFVPVVLAGASLSSAKASTASLTQQNAA